MKRLLALNHFLYNARHKPDYVRKWVRDLLRESRWTPEGLKSASYNWQNFSPPVEYDEIEPNPHPVLREFDFQRVKPFVQISSDPNITPTLMLMAVFAENIPGSRFLDRTNVLVSYDMANSRYCLHNPSRPIPRLNDDDRRAFDVIAEVAVTKFTEKASN